MTLHVDDDQVSGEDRETIALLRAEADRVAPHRGPDLEPVLTAARRRVSRRRAGWLAVAAVAVTALAQSVPEGPQRALPAAPGPEVTVAEAVRSPVQLYAEVDEAVAERGVEVPDGFRWRSKGTNLLAGVAVDELTRRVEGLPPEGVPASGFYTEGRVPSLGAVLAVVTSRLEQDLPRGVELCSYYTAVEEGAACTAEERPDGQLVRLVYADGEGAAAAALHGDSLVYVESRPDRSGSGPDAESASYVPLEVLVALAGDPRLRW